MFLQQLPAALPAAAAGGAHPVAGLAGTKPRGPPPTPSCWSSTLPCRISPVPPTGTTAILSPSSPPGAVSLELQLLCLDPAPFVDASLAAGRSGGAVQCDADPACAFTAASWAVADARAVALDSPFPAENLGAVSACRASPPATASGKPACRPVSDALAALASRPGRGNYLAFFPSYAYLRQVCEDFAARYPDIRHPCAGERLGRCRAGGVPERSLSPCPARRRFSALA